LDFLTIRGRRPIRTVSVSYPNYFLSSFVIVPDFTSSPSLRNFCWNSTRIAMNLLLTFDNYGAAFWTSRVSHWAGSWAAESGSQAVGAAGRRGRSCPWLRRRYPGR
jgi:hypothetical protein